MRRPAGASFWHEKQHVSPGVRVRVAEQRVRLLLGRAAAPNALHASSRSRRRAELRSVSATTCIKVWPPGAVSSNPATTFAQIGHVEAQGAAYANRRDVESPAPLRIGETAPWDGEEAGGSVVSTRFGDCAEPAIAEPPQCSYRAPSP